MTRKPWIRISALVTVLALCLSLPRLFPILMHASALDKSYGFSDRDMALGDSRQPAVDGDSFPPKSKPSDPRHPGADGDDIKPEPDREGGDTASDEFDKGDTPPARTDEDDEYPESPIEPEPEPEITEEEPEEPLTLGVSGLIRSSRSVPGYNVFEVDSYNALAEALRNTSYPSQEYPEASVYILLTGNVTIEAQFTLHQSIDKVVIDGDSQHTLTEVIFIPTQVSSRTKEVAFKDLNIIGYQYYGLFYNPYDTDVSYIYERVTYTGPQILWAPNSTARFTDCDINISGAGNLAHEVAEIRDVYIYGDNQFRHNSPNAVFWLYNGGNLVLSHDATLRINATGDNNYILWTTLAQSKLRLEDRASLHIEGTSSQLAANAGLHSIYLDAKAVFDWKAHRPGADYIAVNNFGGAKDALYLSEGAAFRVEPSSAPTNRLIRINGGNVVVGQGASLSLQAILYNAPGASAPFSLAAGSSLTVGNSATLIMDVRNRNNLTSGLLSFDGAASSFRIERDATVVIRGNKATGAVYFSGSNSSVEITDPNYLEIATTNGNPFHFSTASPANTSSLTYTDVQQLNYWYWGIGNALTYLDGGIPTQRWVAKTGALTIKATISGNGNGGLVTQLTDGQLDSDWTSTMNATDFRWGSARILSAGKIGMEVSSEGFDYKGRITVPNMDVPYSQGKVQVRAGRPGQNWAVSQSSPATPEFHVRQFQAVGPDVAVSVWAEYGYIFHNNPPTISGGALSLTVPDQIEFGVVTIAPSDMAVPAVEQYSLQVQDPGKYGWQVMASFSGFSNAHKSLNSLLLVNDVPLQETPIRIAASAGNETVPLDASLLVPGGAAEAGNYAGNITWTLVDAP